MLMAQLARAEVFAADEVAIVHVMNCEMQRNFLLGDDPVTGRNYGHQHQQGQQTMFQILF